jgi:hypothetical protein
VEEDDFLTRLQADIAKRLDELEPLVNEAADLEAALSELERDGTLAEPDDDVR